MKVFTFALSLFFLSLFIPFTAFGQEKLSTIITDKTALQQEFSAQNTSTTSSSLNFSHNSIDSQQLRIFIQSTLLEVMGAASCQLSGMNPLEPSGLCLGVTQTGELTYTNQQGAIAGMGSLIGGTFSIPVSSTQYIAQTINDFGITKSTYAQTSNGIGFSGLTPLLGLWEKFRNMVYVLYTLLFMFIGLGIILRLKVDPRAIMTIQNQIPKIVINIVLVTFSFAIAGFLIDMMYVTILLLVNILRDVSPASFPANTDIALSQNVFVFINQLFDPNVGLVNIPGFDIPGDGVFNLAANASNSVGVVISGYFTDFLNTTTGNLFTFLFLPLGALKLPCTVLDKLPSVSELPFLGIINKVPLIGSLPFIGSGGPECSILEHYPGLVVRGITSIIAFLVVMFAIMWALFKLWFQLLKAYVLILIDTIFAPLWIGAGLIPGTSLGFGSWLRHILKQLVMFPITIGMFLLGRILMDSFGSTGESGQFVAPLVGFPSDSASLSGFIGLGIILMTPRVTKIAQDLLKATEIGYSGAIGEELTGGYGRARQIPATIARYTIYPERDQRGEIVLGGPIGERIQRSQVARNIGQIIFRRRINQRDHNNP